MRSSLAIMLVLVLSACALPQQRSRAFVPYQPLEAYITTAGTVGGPLFHVNRPAYVAVFYILPGGGVSMLYPGFGSGSLSGRVFAGAHFASSRISNRQQYLFTAGTYLQPRFYFLIASDRPLNVNQFGTFGDGLRSRLGTSFASYSAYSTMEDLARLTLPSLADDGSWTTDMYVEWPSVLYNEPARGRVLLHCAGYQIYVPRGYLQTARAMLCDRTADEDGSAERKKDADAEPVVKPKSRRPLPADAERTEEIHAITAAQRQALIERISSSRQLAAPGARPEIGGRGEMGGSAYGSRARPSMGAGSSSADGGRGSAPASPRPVATGASSGPAAAPTARPSSGSGGSVSAPASRPSTSSGGGEGSSSRGGRSAPTAD